jgi:hypothetical protein
MSELKLECLDGRRKAVKAMYQEHIDAYVRQSMGRPLDRIQVYTAVLAFNKIVYFK